jgi:hypothetical protein
VPPKVNKTQPKLLQRVAEMEDQARPGTLPSPCEQQGSAGGVVHELPADVHKALVADPMRSVLGWTSRL